MAEIPALRLELLRLVYRHDHPPQELIARATQLGAYVVGKPAPKADKPTGDRPKT